MSEPATSFQMLMNAYVRGYDWTVENGFDDTDGKRFVHKAAYDYADKMTAPGSQTSLDRIMTQAAHVRLGIASKSDITEAAKVLCDMLGQFIDGAENE